MDDAPHAPEVFASTLPGVGKKYVMPLASGGSVAILVKPDGERQLFHFLEDEDRPCDVVKLRPEEGQQVAALVGTPTVATPDPERMELVLGALEIEWVDVPEGSHLVGRTLGDSRLRRRTGASVVAILRGEEALPNPGVEAVFEAGDVLVLIGDDAQTDAARAVIEGTDAAR